MELPYNGYETIPKLFITHSPCQQRKSSVPRIHWVFLSCWPMGHITIVGTPGCAPELDGKSLLLKTPHTTYLSHNTWRLQAGAPLQASSYCLEFLVLTMYWAHFQRRKVSLDLTKLWTLQPTTRTDLITKDHWCNIGMNIMKAKPLSDRTEGPFHEMEPTLGTMTEPKTCCWMS